MGTKTTFSGNYVMLFFKKFKFKIYIFALCLILVVGYFGMIDQGHEYKRELNLISHPANVKIIESKFSSINLKVSDRGERSDIILQFYNDELKQKGWTLSYEEKKPEVHEKRGMTGRYFRYFIYTKGNLKLAVSWLDAPDAHVNDYTISAY